MLSRPSIPGSLSGTRLTDNSNVRVVNHPPRLLSLPRYDIVPSIGCLLLAGLCLAETALGCCAVSASGVPAVNADQTVILIWDRERQTEHFIRRASFRSEGDSVGFIVPTPSRPQLEESGNKAFPYLAQITAPREPVHLELPIGCAAGPGRSYAHSVRLIEEKTVAGYHAVVLAADSGSALVSWLRDHGYAFTPDVAAWAQPYLEQRWYMTAMKIAKDRDNRASAAIAASALRITFKTDRPLFPYREPDSRHDAALLDASARILRIYFVAESRYEGRFPSSQDWGGTARWSRPMRSDQRSKLLQYLGLPESTGPAEAWLTEFEDHWPYSRAPGDVYFSESADQRRLSSDLKVTVDPTLAFALGLSLILPLLHLNRLRRNGKL